MNQINADIQKPLLTLAVSVDDSFGNNIGDDLPDMYRTYQPISSLVDIRWKGVFATPDQKPDAHADIIIDRWYMTSVMKERLKNMMTEDDAFEYRPFVLGQCFSYQHYFTDPIDLIFSVNICLAIIAHFGLEADYDPKFMKMMEPIFDHCFLHAWVNESESASSIRNRMIAGEAIPRPEFIRRFDRFLTKYGM